MLAEVLFSGAGGPFRFQTVPFPRVLLTFPRTVDGIAADHSPMAPHARTRRVNETTVRPAKRRKHRLTLSAEKRPEASTRSATFVLRVLPIVPYYVNSDPT